MAAAATLIPERPKWTGLLLALILFSSGCGSEPGSPYARHQLKTAFKQAHRQEDAGALMDLYFLEGVRPEDRALLRVAARNEVVLPIASIRFEAAGPEDRIDYILDGVRYEPSLPVSLKMVVSYRSEERLAAAYLVGVREGRCFLVTARPVPGSEAEGGE